MNTFEYNFSLNNVDYRVFIDSSKNDFKRILINNNEIVNEEYTLALNHKAYIIYYPIEIDGNELVISIDDTMLKHNYNLFLNNISLLDNSRLNDEYLFATNNIKDGFKKYVKNNWLHIFRENLLFIIGTVFFLSFINGYTEKEFTLKFLLSFIIVPVFLPVIIWVEWLHNKNIIKKYKNCFRGLKKYKSRNTGDGSPVLYQIN